MAASKGRRYNYEGMFLVSQAVAADLGGIVSHIEEILTKHSAELLAMKKWDERRLSYEIEKQKRGTYLLTYFSCDPVDIEGIDRDCNLSERIMRVLVLRADHLTIEEIQATDARQELADESALRRSKAEQQEAAASA